MKNLITLATLIPEEWKNMVDLGARWASERNVEKHLEGKIVGIYFSKSSTRTRTSFTAAALRLGAHVIHYGKEDLQISTGESLSDTGIVLSGYLDALVARTNGPASEMWELGAQKSMGVVNAMSNEEHPTQALTDFITISQIFGRSSDLHMVYVGEGNNTAVALMYAAALTSGLRLTIVTPEGYGVPPEFLFKAREMAALNGASLTEVHSFDGLKGRADIVYTSRWETMGVPHEGDWRSKFQPYSISEERFQWLRRNGSSIFLHDLPANRGEEVESSVLDASYSRAFLQAENKLYGAMVSLLFAVDLNLEELRLSSETNALAI